MTGLPGKWETCMNRTCGFKKKEKEKTLWRHPKKVKDTLPGSSLSVLQEPSGFPQKCICTCTHTHITPYPKPESHHLSTYSTEILELSLPRRFGTRPEVALACPWKIPSCKGFPGGEVDELGHQVNRLLWATSCYWAVACLSVLSIRRVDLSDKGRIFLASSRWPGKPGVKLCE